MKDVLNLYLFLTQPDEIGTKCHRGKYVPFLRRNLSYMRPDVRFLSKQKPKEIKKEHEHSPCGANEEDELSFSLMSPSLSFYKILFHDDTTDYDYANIQCYQTREEDGQFTAISLVEGGHFHMKLNEELKVDIDLPTFTPELPEGVQLRYDYLLIKAEIRPEGIAVSGGRRLRSVPARQAAQSELRASADPEHPATSQPEPKVLFGVCKIAVARQGTEGHSVREGRVQVALIGVNELEINPDDSRWMQDRELTRRILKRARRPGRHPFVRLEVFVDDVDAISAPTSAATSTRSTPAPNGRFFDGPPAESGDSSMGSPSTSTYLMHAVRKRAEAGGLAASPSNSSASSVVSSCASTPRSTFGPTSTHERGGILGIVSHQFQDEMLNAPFPKRMAWCFRMSDGVFEQPPVDEKNLETAYLASLNDPPPADVYRFTGNYCAICNPEYRCPFPTFVSLLYHLATCHPRLCFRFRKNLVSNPDAERPSSSTSSPVKQEGGGMKRRSNQLNDSTGSNSFDPADFCPGLIVSLDTNYNGAHEADTSRHFVKRLSVVRLGAKVRRIPDAWSRPPLMLVVPNIARHMREYPPPHRLDAFEFRNYYNDGTFGSDPTWLDTHFHTRRYAVVHAPFKKLTHKRRIREYVDVNENEKAMLTLLSEFHSSFRSLLMPNQAYGSNVILVNEQREYLLKPPIYMQFCIHLCNQLKIGNLRKAEWYDILARLKHGEDYDPRADPLHFVHNELRYLEEQRPIQIEIMNNKKGGKKAAGHVPWNSRENSAVTTDDDNSREGGPTRKRSSVDASARAARPKRTRDSEGGETPPDDGNGDEGDKKRKFCTETPMDVLQRPEILEPTEVPVNFYDDLVCRYQFATEKQLQSIWHFCRKWTRQTLEWQ
ncbi:hypothetical protein M3Y99_01428000 [Aphelenchoides fujianensis]|nr:hypothetical protein M3Y99_01428000 [Aphelenchoides fujianensis]